MPIWLQNRTQNIQKYMQIWSIPISPLAASTNSPGHVTNYFRTSMSEATPPQGPGMWYITLYQNKVLIYKAIVTKSLSISHKPLLYEAKEKYRGVFEIQKSGDKTSSGEIGLDIRTHASPKVGRNYEAKA